MHANTIETTANQQGWTLHTGFAGGQWLETSSPAGEDLIIDVPSGRPIPETVHEHAEQFDPDEHVRALVRSPMKGQPGTIAELLEDAKAIQTMLDRLDAALSAPPDDDPHWEQWTAEALDEMLDDVAHKASSLAQTVLWHHHAANHGIETPENTRRQCLDTLDDLRDLMNRDASSTPSHDGEEKRRRQARHPKESPPASGRRTGTAPGGQRGSHRPFANPGRPTPPDPTQTPRPAKRDDGETGEALSDEGAAPPACPLPGCKAPKGGHHRIPSASTPRTRHDSPARNPPQGAGRTIFSFRPVGFASGSYRRRGTRQRATQRAAPGAIANDGTRFGR